MQKLHLLFLIFLAPYLRLSASESNVLTRLFSNAHEQLLLACAEGKLEDATALSSKKLNFEITDAQGRTPLHIAVESGNTALVAWLLSKNARTDAEHTQQAPNTSTEVGQTVKQTPLLKAIKGHKNVIVYLLISHNAPLNALKDGQAPLIESLVCLNPEAALHLINTGADTSITDASGKTPLLLALMNYDKDPSYQRVIESLLSRGTGLNTADKEGWTPLLFAAHTNMYKVALLFLEKGADTKVRSADGWTPLLCATRHNATELAKRLLDAKADHTVTISFLSDTWTPLLFAAKNGNADIVFALLEKGHSCKDALGTGATALHLAIEPHNLILVRKLAKLIDPNSCDKDGSTALHSACMYGMVDIIKVLMKRGAKINAKDKAGKTPLHVAVSAKKDEAVLHLLTYPDIQVNVKDNLDCTPLHHTAEHNDKKIAQMLLNARASGYIHSKNGFTPYQLAQAHGYLDVWQLIILYDKIFEVLA